MNTLHWETHAGNGPPVLFVHGFLSSRAQWLPNLESFREFCTPVLVELWGHGRSPAPDDAKAYTSASYLRQFEAIRCELGVERWCLVGQSLGASLTLRYSLDHPGRVIAQVFTNSNSALATREQTQQRLEAAAAAIAAIETAGLRPSKRSPFTPNTRRGCPPTFMPSYSPTRRLSNRRRLPTPTGI